MIIKPKAKGFLFINSHPLGCYFNIIRQINFIKKIHLKKVKSLNHKQALVIGSSTGYGLSSSLYLSFGLNYSVINIFMEKQPRSNKTGSSGWYNIVAYYKECRKNNLGVTMINGNAFSYFVKRIVINSIQKHICCKIDLVIYSLASPKKYDERNGKVYKSVLKPLNNLIFNKNINIMDSNIKFIKINYANRLDLISTIQVMGGGDWIFWINIMLDFNIIENNAITLAYSYVGPKITYNIYKQGTIGYAKKHLYKSSKFINGRISKMGGRSMLFINESIVTQASSAIPFVPFYISTIFSFIKKKQAYYNSIIQINNVILNSTCRNKIISNIFLDDHEVNVNKKYNISKVWKSFFFKNRSNINMILYKYIFCNLFGFRLKALNYNLNYNYIISI